MFTIYFYHLFWDSAQGKAKILSFLPRSPRFDVLEVLKVNLAKLYQIEKCRFPENCKKLLMY